MPSKTFRIFSITLTPFLLYVSTTLIILQYISFPLFFRNPPDIFWRFLHFPRSLSLILFSNGTEKSCMNKRWFSLYFSSRPSSAFSSCFAIFPFVVLFCCLPSDRISSYLFSYADISSSVNNVPSEICFTMYGRL